MNTVLSPEEYVKDYDNRNQVYPALTQSNFDNYLENSVETFDPFRKPVYEEKEFERPSNFEMYVKAAKASKVIVADNGEIKSGPTYWSQVEFDNFKLPGQGEYKKYCKKWISKGCDNVKQHPGKKHYYEHTLKSCKVNSCPKCFVDWVNRQANRSTRRFMKFVENKQYNFRHIVLSPPEKQAKNMTYKQLKKWFDTILKIANIKTAAVVFHPFRFHDREKVQPYVSPHFHLIVYGKVTNTTEFYNKSGWVIKNRGDLGTEMDIFNCVRYMLSHAGIKKKSHSIRYLGDISYRKLKVEKEPSTNHCPHCGLPLTIFRIVPSTKAQPPPLFTIDEKGKTHGAVGLYESSCFEIVEVEYNQNGVPVTEIPFYNINQNQEVEEEFIYSFEENFMIASAQYEISKRLYEITTVEHITALSSKKLTNFT